MTARNPQIAWEILEAHAAIAALAESVRRTGRAYPNNDRPRPRPFPPPSSMWLHQQKSPPRIEPRRGPLLMISAAQVEEMFRGS